MEGNTLQFMNEIFEGDRQLIETFAGVVFALHQDTLQKYAVNLFRTDDILTAAALDKLQPHPLGDFPTRLGFELDALTKIDREKLTSLHDPSFPAEYQNDKRRHSLSRFIARMQSEAARVWLLTMASHTIKDASSRKRIELSVFGIWSMLRTVTPEQLSDHAISFSGSFYEDGKSTQINIRDWPKE